MTPPVGYNIRQSGISHGTVSAALKYTSTVAGNTGMVKVYTPPGYSTSQKYSVLFLIHGCGGSYNDWTIGAGPNGNGNGENSGHYLRQSHCRHVHCPAQRQTPAHLHPRHAVQFRGERDRATPTIATYRPTRTGKRRWRPGEGFYLGPSELFRLYGPKSYGDGRVLHGRWTHA